ncbi:Neuronal calcium sensor 1 [Cucumispora dikerogammari]|nr:Neuronal calcium sensor 1 [Cucumispora dikerogammari]
MGNQVSRTQFDQSDKQFSHFKASDISKWKKLFIKTFPSGYIKAKCLESFFYRIFPFALPKNVKFINPKYMNTQNLNQEEVLEYSYFLFKNINISGSGKIDFSELYIAFSILTEGSSFEKIRWLYRLFDLNQDGYVSKDELSYSLQAYSDMVLENFSDYEINSSSIVDGRNNTIIKIVEEIFEKEKKDNLSFDEFKKIVENKNIMQFFDLPRNNLMCDEEFYVF